MRTLLSRTAAALALAMIFSACTQKNTADQPAQSADASVALGIDRLLLFPNPIGTDPFALDGGTFETDTTQYATAYYAAIDAANAKDTIDKWRAANGFTGYANPARPGTEHLAVFRDVKDLGYGRRMTGRRNSDDGSVAFYVENYNVAPNGSAGYSSDLNVDAAIRRDTQWHVGTNAIEWTATPCIPGFDPADCDGTVKFAKYYNFSSADGTRQLAVDLDGHGKKAMPGPCITCHGGRGDPLTPPDASAKPRFPLVENLPSRKRGDVGAHLHGMNVDSFGFSTTQANFAKSDLQPFLADFNQWILCTYPSPTAATVNNSTAGTPWGSCVRPIAGQNEWQGTAAEMIQSWYGGPAMPGPFSDTYVPAGWNSSTAIAGTTFAPVDLYKNVVEPYCRTCHILRGTKNQDDINFFTYGTPAAGVTPATGFLSLADRIKVHVFDRGNMPLAQIPHSDFWGSSAPQMLASFIDSQLGAGTATSSSGAPLMPGRPIADPGPDRMVRTGANAVLTGENSLFASTFSWTHVSGPSSPVITNANGMVAIFNANVAGTYVENLSVNGGASSKNVTITVDDNFPDPLNIKFAQVKNVLQNVVHTGTTQQCISCHTPTANVAVATRVPPIWYTNFDRDLSGGAVDKTDDDWFLKALAGRVNLTEIGASPLLRKPTGNHHNGLKVIDTADTSTNGNGGLRNYSILYNWVLAGMQPGGVAANPIVSASNTLTFSGSPLYSTGIALDGTTSIGPSADVPPTNFLWEVITGPSGPTGAVPFISNPTSPSAVLFVPNVTTTVPYVVQLHVDDGVSSDAVQRSITVSEPTIGASFSPTTGPVLPTSPALGRGNITLHSTSSYITPPLPGNPATCRWQVLSVPSGALALLDGTTTLDITKPCATDAILNIPTTPAGGQYQVQLTASTLGTSAPVTNTLAISSSAPTASLAATAASFARSFVATANTMSVAIYDSAFAPANSLGNVTPAPAIVQSSTSVTLDGSLSTTPVGTLIYSWCLTSQPDAANFAASIAACPSLTSSGASPTIAMNVRATGTYGVQLTVDNGSSTSTTPTKSITVTTSQGKTFGATIVPVIGATPCDGCHQVTAPLTGVFNTAVNSGFPPAWANANTLGGIATTLYQRVRQRVNLASPAASLIIVCPNASCDGGAMPAQANFSATGLGSNYDNFLKWIQDGAPPGD
jgi:mono/diheme cytochrome c family protein